MLNFVYMRGTNCTSYYANRPHDYLAIHFTAGITSRKGSARNTAAWFANPQNTNGSADWIVDDFEAVCYNDDPNRRCWAVGDNSTRYSKGGHLYGTAVNCNTVSIEICSSNRAWNAKDPANSSNWYFTDAAIQNALELTIFLMKKYNIPYDHVVRHYDISGKFCPGIIGWNANSGSETEWLKFKSRLKAMLNSESEEIDMTKQEVEELIEKKISEKLIGLNTKPDEWAEKEVEEAKALKITDGSRPKGYATRQEVMIMVKRDHISIISSIGYEIKKIFEKMLKAATDK